MENNYNKKYLKYKMKYLELKNQLGGAKISPSGLTDTSVKPSATQASLKRAKIGDVIKDEEDEILGTIVKDNDKFWFLDNGGSVNKDSENIQTLNYNGLIGILVNEIQNMKKEIKDLKNKIK